MTTKINPTTLETITLVLDSFFDHSRPSREHMDAKIETIINEYYDDKLSGDGACDKIAITLLESYGHLYSSRGSAAALLGMLKIPFTIPDDETS